MLVVEQAAAALAAIQSGADLGLNSRNAADSDAYGFHVTSHDK